jgi:hypothetical protein
MKNVLVVSHERSGTHFLMNTIGQNFPPYDSINRIDVHCKDYIYPEESYKERYKKEIENFFAPYFTNTTNRIFKSHHQFNYYDGYFDKLLETFVVFYITRDPRDVLASCFRYFNEAPVTAFPKCETIEEFLFETPPYLYPYDGAYSYDISHDMIERVGKHIKFWTPMFDKINVISYKTLKENFQDEVEKISNALGMPAQKGTFNVPNVNYNSIHPGNGKAGNWSNVMSEKVGNKIVERLKDI